MKTFIKKIGDAATNTIKGWEERSDPDAVVLDNFSRSLQIDTYSCGAQSTFMILRYYGKARTAQGVERALGTTEEGTTEDQIRRLLVERGLRPRRITRPTIAKLRAAIDEGCPVLVSVDAKEIENGHWAVVYGYTKAGIYVADPSLKRAIFCRHDNQQFLRRWDRWALVCGTARPKS